MKADLEDDDYITASVAVGEDLDAEFRRVAADMGRWVEAWAEAEEQVVLAKAQVKLVEAEVSARTREEMTAAFKDNEGPKPTIDAVAEQAAQHPRIRVVHERLARALREKVMARGMVRSIEVKRDMIVGLGADKRREMETIEPSVRLPREDRDEDDDEPEDDDEW